MARPKVSAGGGFPAILYVFRKAVRAGGFFKLYARLRSKNACKTCALGMGGQKGGMVNEKGHFPEVCKKSVQAQAGDMQAAITEDFFRTNSLDGLKTLTSLEFENLGRLGFPLLAEPDDKYFRRISWAEAIDRSTEFFRKADPQKVFFYSSGRSSNEASFLMQLVARAYGTPHIHNCSFYCHQASGVALNQLYGSGTASVTLDDLDQADLALVAGANPASNHPRLLSKLIELRRRGGKVIIVNPLKELGLVRFRLPSDWKSLLFGSKVSDLYLQPHIGADIALFLALIKGVIEKSGLDQNFISQHTTGFLDVAKDLENYSMAELQKACGVPAADINAAVDLLIGAKRGIFLWAMGLTHHAHGVNNILALGNLALSRGWLGRPGCGLLPIRGHSNVQGVGTMGVSPSLKKAFADKLTAIYGIKIPENSGLDTFASMVAADEAKVDAAFLLGGNLFSSNPDRSWAAQAMRKIPFTFSVTTKLNEGHVWGRGQTAIIVPVLARDEESQATTQESMFNFVRLSDGGEPNIPGEMRSEVEVIAALAERLLPQGVFDWKELRSHEHLRQTIARVVPGMEKMAGIGKSKQEFQVEGRTFHEPRFGTVDGKAPFAKTPLPEFAIETDKFRLMTLRSEGQFNTVVYEEEDLYRGIRTRDVVMMSRQDAKRLNLAEGEWVWVKSETGRMKVKTAFVDLPTGNLAMYYPEANALVPKKIDSRSKTPAFKSIVAEIEKA